MSTLLWARQKFGGKIKPCHLTEDGKTTHCGVSLNIRRCEFSTEPLALTSKICKKCFKLALKHDFPEYAKYSRAFQHHDPL